MEPLIWHTSIQGTPPFRGQNLLLEKCPHNLCIYYLFWRDSSTQGKGTLFLCANPDTLELEKWLTAKWVISLSVPLSQLWKLSQTELSHLLGRDTSSVWNFCIEIPQTSLHGKTSDVICFLWIATYVLFTECTVQLYGKWDCSSIFLLGAGWAKH